MNRSATAIGIGVLAIAALVGVILFLQLPSPDAPTEQASTPAQRAPAAAEPETAQAPSPVTSPAEPSAAPVPTADSSGSSDRPMAPKFDVVRVDRKGNVVIAGKAEPDCTVTVRDGDTVVGTATSDRRGDWVIVPGKPLDAGEIQLGLSSKCGDADAQSADRVVVLIVPERPASGPAVASVAPAPSDAENRKITESSSPARDSAGTAREPSAPARDTSGSTREQAMASGGSTGAAPVTSSAGGTPADHPAGADAQLAARAASESGDRPEPTPTGDVAKPKTNDPGTDTGGAIVIAIPRNASKPGEVMQAPQGPAGGVSVGSVDYDDKGEVVITGKAEPNSTVQVYLDNRIVGRAESGSDGMWQLVPETPVTPGRYTLRADMVTREGTVVARSEIPFVRGEPLSDLPAGRVVVIQPGDYLWKIARASYGSGARYTLIYDANRAQIGDPDLIYPGQVFTLPRVN